MLEIVKDSDDGICKAFNKNGNRCKHKAALDGLCVRHFSVQQQSFKKLRDLEEKRKSL